MLCQDGNPKGNGVRDDQPDIALDSAIPPDLLVDLPDQSTQKNTGQSDERLSNQSGRGNPAAGQYQHEKIDDHKHDQIQDNQFPPYFEYVPHSLIFLQQNLIYLCGSGNH